MALNAPIQGSAADIIKVAMLQRGAGDRRARGCASRMLLQVHDELVLEVAAGEREALEDAGPPGDGRGVPAVGPLEVSVGCGPGLERRRPLRKARCPRAGCRGPHRAHAGRSALMPAGSSACLGRR